MSGPLLQRDDGPVRILTLNRPDKRNAFTTVLYDALAQALRAADADLEVGAVVLTGAGPAYSAGTDLQEMAAMAAGDTPRTEGDGFPSLLAALSSVDVPLVAAVNGPGVGLGATMLSYCDLVFIAEGAWLKTPFAELGVPPEAGSSYLFPIRMGWQKAARALLAADPMSPAEAVDAGLATAVCAPDRLLPEAVAAAQRIASHDHRATRRIKALMRVSETEAVAAAMRRENDAFRQVFEGRRAAASRATTGGPHDHH
jgi:enoyl-CoA hydratase/carnithine racemase